MPYSISFDGKCESNEYGDYPTLEECERACHSIDAKELQYLIYEYAPGAALRLAPSDQVMIVKNLTGVLVDPIDTPTILQAIEINDYETLSLYDKLLPWIRKHHPYALVCEIPAGSLSEVDVLTFGTKTEQEITALGVANGLDYALLRRGDVVRFADVPLRQGSLVSWNSATSLLERTPYEGYRGGSAFAINSFPRVDYFRYAFPGNAIVFRTVTTWEEVAIERISSRIWKVTAGRYHIFTRDLAKLQTKWVGLGTILYLYYISPWDSENRPFDMYTEPH